MKCKKFFNCKIVWITAFIEILIVCNVYGRNIEISENPKQIQQRAGYDITLKCGLKTTNNVEPSQSKQQIRWYFKACGDDNQDVCSESNYNNWTKLPCNVLNCSFALQLTNVTEKQSGLYKCILYPYKLDETTVLDIQLVRFYQLDIKNSTVLKPKFVETLPKNQTAVLGSRVVFQCRVQSKAHPTIKWFKRISNINAGVEFSSGIDNFNSRIVRYFDNTYELLDSAKERLITDEVYLSKLILNDVDDEDIGYYACVAINYRGHTICEAYLNVYFNYNNNRNNDEKNFGEYEYYLEEKTDPMEFLLLFLIPIGLALLPLSFWVCYILKKRCSQKQMTDTYNEQKALR